MSLLRGARAAVVFLTRVPAGGFPYSREEWAWAPGWFPLIGASIGILLVGGWTVARPLGDFVAATLVYTASLLLTGAFHEDGLADTADALGGGTSRDRVFAILKDSRIGTFGGLALVVSLILRIGLLARLAPVAAFALVSSQCIARLFPVWLMVAMPYVTPDDAAKSRPVARAAWAQVMLATLFATLVIVTLDLLDVGSAVDALICAAVAGFAALVAAYRFHRRAGGVTGDFLGATEQIGECAVLIALGFLHRAQP